MITTWCFGEGKETASKGGGRGEVGLREEGVRERERQTDRQKGGKRRRGGGGFRQERCSSGGDAASGTALPRQNAAKCP